MTKEELNEILEKHSKWLNNEKGGECADFINADLIGADLRCANLKDANLKDADLRCANLKDADLRCANLKDANLIGADLRCANLMGADLRCANLKDANLIGADLRCANLKDANLDYSCLPLWCGSLKANFDDRQLIQIAYHLVKAGLQSSNASDETKAELSKLIDFANKFHRVDECGLIENVDCIAKI